MQRQTSIKFILMLALVVFFLDRLMKEVVVTSLRLGEDIPLVPGILSVTYAKNPGAASGIFGDSGSIVLLASIVSLAILIWGFRLFPASLFSRVGSGLVFGGAASNLADRLFVGAVTDYVHFFWWVLNGADAAMTVGAAVLTFSVLKASASR